MLAEPQVHEAFVKYCRQAAEFRIGVGRYVLMPDHIHLFVCFGIGCRRTLSAWVKGLKRQLNRVLISMAYRPLQLGGQKFSSFWQPGFNDHLLRSNESYTQKWEYVFENPVRAGLVARVKIGRTQVRLCELIESNLESYSLSWIRILLGRTPLGTANTTNALRQRTLQRCFPS